MVKAGAEEGTWKAAGFVACVLGSCHGLALGDCLLPEWRWGLHRRSSVIQELQGSQAGAWPVGCEWEPRLFGGWWGTRGCARVRVWPIGLHALHHLHCTRTYLPNPIPNPRTHWPSMPLQQGMQQKRLQKDAQARLNEMCDQLRSQHAVDLSAKVGGELGGGGVGGYVADWRGGERWGGGGRMGRRRDAGRCGVQGTAGRLGMRQRHIGARTLWKGQAAGKGDLARFQRCWVQIGTAPCGVNTSGPTRLQVVWRAFC